MQPNIRQVSKSVPLDFLVYSLLLFGHMENMGKCNQMMPSTKSFADVLCKLCSNYMSVKNILFELKNGD